MKDKLISFETAKLAKEKGFDVPTSCSYINEKLYHNTNLKKGRTNASAQSLLQRWLREKHLLFLESKQTSHCDTEWKVVDVSGNIKVKPGIWPYYDGYPVKGHMFEESGYEVMLQEALKLIK